MVEDSKDCLECRLISGFGIIGIATYIYYQARHQKKIQNYSMKVIAGGAFGIGLARLFNMEFMKSKKS